MIKLKNVIAGTICLCTGVVIGCVTTITTLSNGLSEIKATKITENQISILDKIKKWFSN